ncbi:(2Fe-2S)-binding protein [Streptomyces sp. NPDC047000]|uniref:(2Fe-2S)-binding protein n=1 Tax=Streptomyces sp. NPDC047000 TaxID=3155474 RepID=UPI0033F75B1F
MNDRIDLTFDGAAIGAKPGQSVGAALTDAGIRSWRTTRHQGRPRGLFCGIGICYDCLLVVDGVPNQRACLVTARDGMRLESHRAAADDTAAGTAGDRKGESHG